MSHERRGRPAERPDPTPGMRPSERASERLAADMRAEIGMTRAAWDDAMLRSDERLHHDDEAGALASLEDQRRLLQLLEHRLQRTVAAAAAERDAEEVLAGVDEAAVDAPTQPASASPGAPFPVESGSSRGRLRALVAAGAATAVTAVAVGLAALAGPVVAPAPQIAGGPDAVVGGYEEPDGDGDTDGDVGPADHGLAAPAPAVERLPWLAELARRLSATPSGDAAGGEDDLRPQGADGGDGDDSGSREAAAAARDADTAGSEGGPTDEGRTGDDGSGTADEPESDDEGLIDLGTLLQSDETDDPADGDGTEDPADGDAGEGDLDSPDGDDEPERGLSRTDADDRDTTTSTG